MSGFEPDSAALHRLAEKYGVSVEGVVRLGESGEGNVLAFAASRAARRTRTIPRGA